MKRRLIVVGLALAALGVATLPADAALPSGAVRIDVGIGAVHAGVDAQLKTADSIAGNIKAAASGDPVYARVTAYLNGKAVQSRYTNGFGHYLIGGLAPSTTGYAVCVDPYSVLGGGSSTGYLGRCYKSAAWNGGGIPSTATLVKVTSTYGLHRTGINIALPSAAAIAGNVKSSWGTSIAPVTVKAHNRSNGITYTGFTDSAGHYRINNLTASSSGYTVCFDARSVTQNSTGFLSRCWKTVAWNAGKTYPSTATPVSVSLGHTTGVNPILPVGGAISGVVTDAASTAAVNSANVVVWTSSGGLLASATTSSTGHYAIKGLPTATGDRVCVRPKSLTVSVTYRGKCWKSATWDGHALPSGTTAVTVSTGHTHTGISFALTKTSVSLGSLGGTVTNAAQTAALQNADVELYSSAGKFLRSTRSAFDGSYNFANVFPDATGYIVCAKADDQTSSLATSTPATGWAPHCYNDVDWFGLAVPSTATTVPVAAGVSTSGVHIGLPVGGAVSGHVYAVATAGAVDSALVLLFTPSGRELARTYSVPDGSFSFPRLTRALAPSGYIVCFDAREVGTSFGYLPQCYNKINWTG